jgi:hypothetical protein
LEIFSLRRNILIDEDEMYLLQEEITWILFFLLKKIKFQKQDTKVNLQ